MIEHPPHHDVAALDQPQAARARQRVRRTGELRRPRPGGINDRLCAHGADAVRASQRGVPAVGPALRVQAARAGQDMGAAVRRVAGVEHDQAGVVYPAVRIDEAARVTRLERLAGRMPRQLDRLRTRQKAPACQMVIEEEASADHPRRTLRGIVRHHETQRPHDVRRHAQQHLALLQCLAHQAEFVIFEVPQPAVDQLGRGRRGVLGQVVFFTQDHRQATAHGITGDTDAVDAASDHQQITVQMRRVSELHGFESVDFRAFPCE